MLRFFIKRVLGLIPVLFASVVLTFAATRALPGDPVAMMLSDHASDAAMAAQLRKEYGLDQPLLDQFFHYIWSILSGNFGLSFRYVHTPVIKVLSESLAISPLLAFSAFALALPLGSFLGIQSALHRDGFRDKAITAVLLIVLSMPSFALATFLVLCLSVQLNVLPVAGWGTFRQAVLPVFVLTLPSAAHIARLTRGFMLEALQQDFIRAARSKGLRERAVIYRHAFLNTLVPLCTSAGLIFGGLLSNTVVVETIFNIPGLGSLAVDSIFARDYPVAMAVVLLFTIFYALINLLVDILYVAIDPRLRSRLTTQ